MQCMIRSHSGYLPTPDKDHGIKRSPKNEELCGFLSMEQLNRWFSQDELEIMERHGFDVVKKDNAKITAVGEYQILFLPE